LKVLAERILDSYPEQEYKDEPPSWNFVMDRFGHAILNDFTSFPKDSLPAEAKVSVPD
jgi:hypothetical protein